MLGNAEIEAEVEFFFLAERKTHTCSSCKMQTIQLETSRRRCDLAGSRESDYADAPEQVAAVFRLVGHEAFIGIASAVISAHHIRATQFFELAERRISKRQAAQRLYRQNRIVVQSEEFPQIDAQHGEIEIAAQKGGKPDVLYLRECTPVGAISVVSGIPGQDGADARSIPAMAAYDVFLVEYASFFIIDRIGVLEFVGDPDVETFMDALEELGIDKVLSLAESFFRRIRCMVAQSPEIVWIIAIGGLEPEDMVFFWKEDSGAEGHDHLATEGIETQDVDIGGADGCIFSGSEEACGDGAETPVGLQGFDDKGEGQQVFSGERLFCGVIAGEWLHFRQGDGNGANILFLRDGIRVHMLPCQGGAAESHY